MTGYRKTITVVLTAVLMAAGTPAQTKNSETDEAGQKELYNYVLSMDKIQKIASATQALQVVAKQHPELNEGGSAKSLDQTVQRFEQYPDAVAILSKNGLTPRKYTVGFMTMLQATMAVGFKKSGTYKEYPPDMLKQVSKANLDFVEQHWDAIQKMTATPSGEK